jgi:hypothetical protein
VSPPTRVHEGIAQAVRCRWHEHSDLGGRQVVDPCRVASLRALFVQWEVSKSGNSVK